MRILTAAARYLLGLIFLVFGLNGFLHFIPMPPPSGLALQFFIALAGSHYLWVIMAAQVVGGVLLLTNRFVPLALAVLGPVIVNILSFHIFLEHQGMPLAVLVTLLWFVVAYRVRSTLTPLLVARVDDFAKMREGFAANGSASMAEAHRA